MSLRTEEDKLFEAWKVNRLGFVADGIVDEHLYLASTIRLLFVLKEVNDLTGGGWDLREFMRSGGRPPTWDNITRWVEGVRALPKNILWSDLQKIDTARRCKALESIGVVNVKKSPGTHTTNALLLKEVAEQDSEYFVRQINLYNPNLIICCGVANIFHDLMGRPTWLVTRRGVSYYEFRPGCFVVAYAHPEARCANNLLYYGLIDAIREIIFPNIDV